VEFVAHRFLFRCRVGGTILLNEHKGAALRGAFNEAVRAYCQYPHLTSCHPCALVSICPVSHLTSPVDEDGRRGSDVPRPYTVQPPIEAPTVFQHGDLFEFGITLYGRALRQLCIVLAGLRTRGPIPLGRKTLQGNGLLGRGALLLEEVVAWEPMAGSFALVMRSQDQLAHMPDLGVTHQAVLRSAQAMGEVDRITLHFLTPTRIVDQGRLLHAPVFRPIFQRLLERISSLWEHYAGASPPFDFPQLMGLAERVRTAEDSTHWVDLDSYSSRRGVRTPIGGFMGTAIFEGPLTPLLPWLIWGEYTHVGKNAVKGDGWYRIEEG